MKNLILAFVSVLLCSLSSMAETDSPIAGGIFPPFQFPAMDQTVYGLRMSPGFAVNKNVYGLDLGLVGNVTTSDFIGTSLSGGFNVTSGKALIFLTQLAGIANHNSGTAHIIGIQIALGYNYASSNNNVYGLQAALANLGSNTIYGVQFGLYNVAETVYGFQIGFINKTKNLRGMQIGLLNFSDDGGFSFFPVLNIGF